MIGKKLSPVLEEIEATLWEFDAYKAEKPEYTLEGFRAAVKIFSSAVMDRMYERQRAAGLTFPEAAAEADKVGNEIRALVLSATGIDPILLYDRTEVN